MNTEVLDNFSVFNYIQFVLVKVLRASEFLKALVCCADAYLLFEEGGHLCLWIVLPIAPEVFLRYYSTTAACVIAKATIANKNKVQWSEVNVGLVIRQISASESIQTQGLLAIKWMTVVGWTACHPFNHVIGRLLLTEGMI